MVLHFLLEVFDGRVVIDLWDPPLPTEAMKAARKYAAGTALRLVGGFVADVKLS